MYIPVLVNLLSLGYMLSVIIVYKTCRVVFPLALVRAASAVPGHSGTPAIEADLRERGARGRSEGDGQEAGERLRGGLRT